MLFSVKGCFHCTNDDSRMPLEMGYPKNGAYLERLLTPLPCVLDPYKQKTERCPAAIPLGRPKLPIIFSLSLPADK